MPGIFGIVSKQVSGKEVKLLEVMRDSLLHEEDYAAALYSNEELGFYAGSIAINNSFSDCMPVYNKKKDIILLFSGECFTESSVIEDLVKKGYDCNPTNANYLAYLYEEQVGAFFENLNGWFRGILINLRKREAVLFNDRYGIQRIYYYEDNEAFYFSSEAKSLLKIFPHLRNLNLDSIAEYYIFDCVLDNKTYFSDINIMPPASAWVISKGSVKKNTYFNPESWQNQTTLGRDEFIEELKSTFERVLPSYFTASSTGMSLTGGLDTRMILACSDPETGQLPCYTFGGMYRDSFDVRIARRVAKACHQSFQVLRLDQKFLNEFQDNAEKTIYVTDGLADVGKSHGIYLNKLAKQIAPVRMTGKFGSQVMRSIVLLRDRSPKNDIFNAEFKDNLTNAKTNFKNINIGHKLSFVLFKEIPWYWSGFLTIEVSQISVRSPFLDNELIKLLYKAPAGIFETPELQMDIINKYNPDLLSIRTNWGLGGNSNILVSRMRHLTHKFLNNSDKFYNWERMPHWMARVDNALAPLHMEKLVLGYDQYNHYRTWFRDDLSGYIRDILLDDRALNRPYINKVFLQKIIAEHTSGRGNYLDELKKILTIELINRLLIEDI